MMDLRTIWELVKMKWNTKLQKVIVEVSYYMIMINDNGTSNDNKK